MQLSSAQRRTHPGTTIRQLPTASFAFVMATGIVSTALSDLGWNVPFLVLLLVAVLGLVVLASMLEWRLVCSPAEVPGHSAAVDGAE